MVIFGASGDLTKRKLIPSLYHLAQQKLLPNEFALVGCAIEKMSEEEYRRQVRGDLAEFGGAAEPCKTCDWLLERTYYFSGDFQDPNTYESLKPVLEGIDTKHATGGNYLYYLATAPALFGEVVQHLGVAGLADQSGHWRRVVIEKPFGHDLDSARTLNHEIGEVLSENQIYRIDHYLGKETVQNILVFRFSNGIFEPVWNRRYIDHVQITVAETLGVEQRGGYYDHAGAARDMVPNHILQLVTLTAMEPPISFGADAVRDEQAKILHAIQPLAPEDVLTRAVRGQYGEGQIEGQPAPAYRAEPHVEPASQTETFVALKLSIDNWRWADVPFYIRAGKCLPVTCTEVLVEFRRPPREVFGELVPTLSSHLRLRLSPEVLIALGMRVKVPGERMAGEDVELIVTRQPGDALTPYERLLGDALRGDLGLFGRQDAIEAQWAVVDPVLGDSTAVYEYARGSWGPREAGRLIEGDDGWLDPQA
jgi:glucose-6-phosphate 1-dehydrogenase